MGRKGVGRAGNRGAGAKKAFFFYITVVVSVC